jgi:TupA-like ATPgrasp
VKKLEHIRRQFRHGVGYELNLARPKTFNEKLQWLKLFHHDPILTVMADKIAMKDLVAERVGAQHVIPTIATFSSADELTQESLKSSCVLKLNNGSGEVLFMDDPGNIDLTALRERVATWLLPSRNHYFYSAEWCYRDIPSRILAEPIIAPPADLVDYKIFCFSGVPRLAMTCSERQAGLKVDFLDTEWTHLPFRRHYPNSAKSIPAPASLESMLTLAARLSHGLPFLRVDFYEVNGRLLVGELTPYPGNGMEPFQPYEWDERLGDWLVLPAMATIRPGRGAAAIQFPGENLARMLDDWDDFPWAEPDPATSPIQYDKTADKAQIVKLTDKLRRMESSLSWRITAPLRALRRATKKSGLLR